MAPLSNKIKINLSSKSGIAINQVFLKWAINVGKMIIVATELIALGALFYRFIVDRQIIDLHDKIKRQETIVKILESKEVSYRNLQERISSVKGFSDENKSKLELMNLILTSVKEGKFSTEKLALQQNRIVIEGETSTVLVLNDLINDLKKFDYVSSINLNDLNTSENRVKFSLNIEFKGGTNGKL